MGASRRVQHFRSTSIYSYWITETYWIPSIAAWKHRPYTVSYNIVITDLQQMSGPFLCNTLWHQSWRVFPYLHYFLICTCSSSSLSSRQRVCREAMKLPHTCLSLASLWMVPQLWFMFFMSAYTVLRQVVFSWPHFHFPSRVEWIAALVMELATLRSSCPIHHHRFLVMMVSISSCWHRAKRSW